MMSSYRIFRPRWLEQFLHAKRHVPDASPSAQQEEWVRADVVLTENEWLASFSDGPFTDAEIEQAGAAIGLVPSRPQEESPALATDSDDVEEIDADAQMREVQGREVWNRQLNPYGSVTELALIMARRPAVQQAIMDEIRQDQALRSAIARATGVVVQPVGPPLLEQGADGASKGAHGGDSDVGDDGGPFDALLQHLAAAARSAGAAIGAYVQRVMQTLSILSKLLRGKRVGSADAVVFDDNDSVSVDRAQVVMDMSIALASLLVLVAVLGRAGAKIFV